MDKISPALSIALLTVLAASCSPDFGPEPQPRDTGEQCEEHEDCVSGKCRSRLCAPPSCDCFGLNGCPAAGQVHEKCGEGFLCRSDNIVHGICSAPCQRAEDCPPHHYCDGDGFCVVDEVWFHPELEITCVVDEAETTESCTLLRVERGARVTVEATASSPIDAALKPVEWTLTRTTVTEGAPEKSSGDTLAFTLREAETGARIRLLVADMEGNTSEWESLITVCDEDSAAPQCNR